MELKDVLQLLAGFVILLLTGFSTVLWFLYQDVRTNSRKALDDLAAYKLDVAKDLKNYVTADGLTSAINDLKGAVSDLVGAVKSNMEETRAEFRNVYNRIDGKQDKEKP